MFIFTSALPVHYQDRSTGQGPRSIGASLDVAPRGEEAEESASGVGVGVCVRALLPTAALSLMLCSAHGELDRRFVPTGDTPNPAMRRLCQSAAAHRVLEGGAGIAATVKLPLPDLS